VILRRTGELAFAIAVIALGGGLLFLAAGRFLEPIAIAPPTVLAAVARVAHVAPARQRNVVHASHPRERVAVAAPTVAAPAVAATAVAAPAIARTFRVAVVPAAVRGVPRAAAPLSARTVKPPVKRVPKKSSARIAHIARRGASGRAPIVEVVVGQAAAPQPFAQIAFAPHQAGPPVAAHSLATLSIPFAPQPKTRPASKPRKHRFGVAYVHVAPKVERTPEPPIGYESRPGLLRADPPAGTAVSPNAH
jgi:hypothetical protein